MDAMTAQDNATAFAQQFVWQHNEELVCPANDASDAVKLDYQLRLRSDALRAIDFWWGAWPAALHIGFAWMGLASHSYYYHYTYYFDDDDNCC